MLALLDRILSRFLSLQCWLLLIYLSYFTGQQVLKLKKPNLHKFVHNLTSLRQLYIDGIQAHGKEWMKALLLLRDLQILNMSFCDLSGSLDSSLKDPRTYLSLFFMGTVFRSQCQKCLDLQ
jgi:hypothetical protein